MSFKLKTRLNDEKISKSFAEKDGFENALENSFFISFSNEVHKIKFLGYIRLYLHNLNA